MCPNSFAALSAPTPTKDSKTSEASKSLLHVRNGEIEPVPAGAAERPIWSDLAVGETRRYKLMLSNLPPQLRHDDAVAHAQMRLPVAACAHAAGRRKRRSISSNSASMW